MKIGDIVQLTSGGPRMTVVDTALLPAAATTAPASAAPVAPAGGGRPAFKCGWFTTAGEYRTELFLELALKQLAAGT